MIFTSRPENAVIVIALFFVAMPLSCVRAQSQEDYASTFRPRSDLLAERDTQALREHLSKLRDVRGPINPLADYVQRNRQTTKDTIDRESETKPALNSSSTGYRSQSKESEKATPATRPASPPTTLVLFPGPIYSMVQSLQTGRAIDGFIPHNPILDAESQVVPTLGNTVFASANQPVESRYPTIITSGYQPELPGGSGGIPGASYPLQNLPNNAPILPNTAPILPNSMGTNSPFNNPSVPIMNAPGNVLPGTATQNAAIPGANLGQSLPVLPGTMPSAPNIIASPLPQGASTTVMPGGITSGNVMPGTVMPSPTPYYPVPVPQAGVGGVVQTPLSSPSDSTLPRYPRTAPIVNGAPFVSSPPCQFDASYMVSPRVYRPATDCGPSGYAPSPYATRPTGSPFSYIPPTAMPGVYRNPPYPILIGFGQNLNNAYLSRGIYGQPKAYMDGQPVRNFLRYLLP